MDNLEITPVPEIVADTTRVCEIRFDWLLSDDDGEDTFLERLEEDLNKLEK